LHSVSERPSPAYFGAGLRHFISYAVSLTHSPRCSFGRQGTFSRQFPNDRTGAEGTERCLRVFVSSELTFEWIYRFLWIWVARLCFWNSPWHHILKCQPVTVYINTYHFKVTHLLEG
jgi:hypothetical protein